MTSKSWITEIKKQMKLKNVSVEGFGNVINTLAEILEKTSLTVTRSGSC